MDAEISRVEGILAKKEKATKSMEKAVNLLKKKGFEIVEDNCKHLHSAEESEQQHSTEVACIALPSEAV